jgi:hypothetical protein
VNWKLGLVRIAALVMIAERMVAGETAGVRVVLIDYVDTPAGVVADAKRTASAILATAGISVEWVACIAAKDEPCPQMTPLDIEVRLQSENMAKQAGLKPACLGYALSHGGLGSIAGVFLHQAVELERVERIPLHKILGAAMSHEIGHLLMAAPGHSRTGLMRARWESADVKMLAQGLLGFSQPQKERMMANARQRLIIRARQDLGTLGSF